MSKEEFISWATASGWHTDRYGHLQRQENGREYRFKLSKFSARHEVKSTAGWVRLRSGYFSKLWINADGALVGLVF